MTHVQHFTAPGGVRPGIGYSHAVAARGQLVAIAGQVAMDENGELAGGSDPKAQAERVFENLRLVLEATGASFTGVVKLGIFVTDISILPDSARSGIGTLTRRSRQPAPPSRWSRCSTRGTSSRSRPWPW
jgi:enamine deaminase RidA (YjgF/YER057c/UK114 family)